jgi:hypothetical protein
MTTNCLLRWLVNGIGVLKTMPEHVAPGCAPKNHGQSRATRRPSPTQRVTVRKVDADSVPYGDSVSHNGRTCWIAVDGDRILCVRATAEQARRAGADILAAEVSARYRQRQAIEDRSA